jgi:hypothetical protein
LLLLENINGTACRCGYTYTPGKTLKTGKLLTIRLAIERGYQETMAGKLERCIRVTVLNCPALMLIVEHRLRVNDSELDIIFSN